MGDSHWSETIENTVLTFADLILSLRLYDARLDTRALVKQLSRASKNSLVESLSYLGHDGMNDYTKEACITALICRVQNLFPDQCSFCREQYCIRLTDNPLLSCQICGQGAHDPCVLDHLQRQSGEHQSVMPSDVWNRINPTNLPGLHYLCEACQKSTIPSEEAGKLKRKPSIKQQSATQGDEQDNLQESSSRTLDVQPTPDQDDHTPMSLNGDNDVSTSQNGDGDRAPPPDTQTNICLFYRKGTCRYGISGRGCPKAHPKPCRKLLQHGTKAPHGCTLGRNCDKFHPRLCASSLRKGVCLKQSCRQWHIAGTNRTPPETDRTLHQDGNVNPQTTETSGFLDALRLLKAEILEAMDLKLALMASSQPAPAQQNMFHRNACDQAGSTATAQMITAPVHWMPSATAPIHNAAAGIPAAQHIPHPYGQDSVVPPYIHPMYQAPG